VIEVLARNAGFGIVADCKPGLCTMRLIHIVGRTRAPILVGTQPGSRRKPGQSHFNVLTPKRRDLDHLALMLKKCHSDPDYPMMARRLELRHRLSKGRI
jgi:hypothetical protein